MVTATNLDLFKGKNARKKSHPEESMLHVAWSIPAGEKAVQMRALLAELGIGNVSEYVKGLVLADLTIRVNAQEAEEVPA